MLDNCSSFFMHGMDFTVSKSDLVVPGSNFLSIARLLSSYLIFINVHSLSLGVGDLILAASVMYSFLLISIVSCS